MYQFDTSMTGTFEIELELEERKEPTAVQGSIKIATAVCSVWAIEVCAQQPVSKDTLTAIAIADTLVPQKSVAEVDTATGHTHRSVHMRSLQRTTGAIEVGGIHGAVPFAVEGSGLWNAYAKGALGVDVLGVPLGITFDLGTAAPIRGQRNKVRFAFDPVRAANLDRWSDAHQLNNANTILDSLEVERAGLQRQLAGQEARAAALHTLALSTALPQMPVDTMMPGEIPLTAPAVEHSVHTPDQVLLLQRADSLDDAAQRTRAKLDRINADVEQARQAAGRAHALAEAGKDGAAFPVRFARGIRRLEIGTCTPRGSEYLINGTTLQGVSFEYAHKELFLAFDHGRSFDDSWRNTDPVANDLMRLQQSLFFADARDLNPKKLTDLRTGFGAVDGTHAHVGYLYGSRLDLPAGVSASTMDGPKLINHVVEVDLGYQVKPGHALRVVHARSIVSMQGDADASADEQTSAGDLFRTGADAASALKATWTSDLHRLGTRIELEGRSISPWFQSFGVGFIRTGSRAAEMKLEQRIGERMRLRAKGTTEERTILRTDEEQHMHVQRGQLGLVWKPLRTLSINASYLPVLVRWEGLTPNTSLSTCYVAGADVRERWRKFVLTLNATTSLYTWSAEGNEQQVLNQNASATLMNGERWTIGMQWTALTSIGTDTVPNAANTGATVGYRTTTGWSLDASAQAPDNDRMAWSCVVRKTLAQRLTIALRAERFAHYATYYNNTDPTLPVTDQAWTLSLAYQW